MRKETKAGPPNGGQDALMRAFEEFKAANDARLGAIERGRGDVLLEEKVDRIDRALAEQKSLIERAVLAGRRAGLGADPVQSEHKSAWNSYLRRGDISALTQFEAKSLSAGSDPDGGYVAPPELDRMIETRLRQVSPMRGIATVRTTGANVFKKPISVTQAGAGWVAETGGRFETKPADASGADATEHGVTLHVWSRYGGRAEALEALAAIRTALHNAPLSVEGCTLVLLLAQFTDVFRSGDGRTTHGVLRMRAITEAV